MLIVDNSMDYEAPSLSFRDKFVIPLQCKSAWFDIDMSQL